MKGIALKTISFHQQWYRYVTDPAHFDCPRLSKPKVLVTIIIPVIGLVGVLWFEPHTGFQGPIKGYSLSPTIIYLRLIFNMITYLPLYYMIAVLSHSANFILRTIFIVSIINIYRGYLCSVPEMLFFITNTLFLIFLFSRMKKEVRNE